MSENVKWQAIVDRIEGDQVVLEMQLGHEVIMPLIYFPREIGDGSVININIEYDPAATRKRFDEIKKLQDEVHGNSR